MPVSLTLDRKGDNIVAWGYEASFTIEHVKKKNKRIRCTDCLYYDESDKSCSVTPRYLPDDGYDSWKYCGEFDIKDGADFKDEKIIQYNKYFKREKK